MHLSLPSIPFLSQPSQGTPRPSLPSSGAFKKWTLHFENVFYPRLCVSCTDRKALPGHCFCPVCRVRVIVQDMYKQSDNEFTERFWGRVPLQTGAALFKFAKKCPIQRALHRLKYGNHPQTGRLLGREMGLKLSKSPHYQQVDVVVCVPLHPLKEKKRGYNQSAVFGESLAEAMGIPFVKNALYRNTHSLSQTKQKRLHRYTNVENVFQVRLPHKLKGKHVLLVDDVLTTGATLECCAQQILEVPGTRISMATIAIA